LNGRRRRAQFRRQVIDANAIRLRKREGPLHRILQFAHVSWPRVPQQQIRRFGRKSRRPFSESFCGSCEELPRNRQNVITPLPQGRHRDFHDPQTIVEILTKPRAMHNLAYRVDDDLVGVLAQEGIAYVPFFPLGGGFTQLQSATVSDVAQRLAATPAQIAIAWLLQRAPNILIIAGTSSLAHLRENMTAAALRLSDEAFATLNELTQGRD